MTLKKEEIPELLDLVRTGLLGEGPSDVDLRGVEPPSNAALFVAVLSLIEAVETLNKAVGVIEQSVVPNGEGKRE